jgi:hypothetical protein
MSASSLLSVAVNEFHITETPFKSDMIHVKYSMRTLSGAKGKDMRLGLKATT